MTYQNAQYEIDIMREVKQMTERYEVPGYMRHSLAEYVIGHKPVGDFLEAVISNNLYGAYAHADGTNVKHVGAYVAYLYNVAPSKCWGSPEKYKAWIEEET